MKLYCLYVFLFLFTITGCGHDKKIYIKSLDLGEGKRIDWYMYSLITDNSPDYIDFTEKHSEKTIFEADQVTNIIKKSDTLVFQVEGSYGGPRKVKIYKFMDSNFIRTSGLKLIIDTTGWIENSSTYRLPKIQKAGVDVFKPHFFDSDNKPPSSL